MESSQGAELYRRGYDRGFWTAAAGIAAFLAGRAAARRLMKRSR